MFHLINESAHIEGISDYVDPKGEKAVGLAIEISVTLTPAELDMFEAGLCAALFKDGDVISTQTAPGKVRRFDIIEALKPKAVKLVGAKVEIRTAGDLITQAEGATLVGLGFNEVTVDRFRLHVMKSSVEVLFRVLIWPDNAGIATLYGWRKSTVYLTVTPPEAAKYEDAGDDDGDAQRRLDDGDGDDDADPQDDGDDHDGPRTSDDLPASAVAADGEAPASTVPVTRRRRRKVEPVFPHGWRRVL